jgi:hypothetical protein
MSGVEVRIIEGGADVIRPIDRSGFGVVVPLRLVSEANSHAHWRQRQKRAKEQRFVVTSALRFADCYDSFRGRLATGTECAQVHLHRVAPRALDSDNLQGAFKHVRDAVAEFLGLDDRSGRYEWVYGQQKARPKEYGVRVMIVIESEMP